MMYKFSTRRGFTLIELLVVVLIIGILSAIALPQYTKVVEKARMTEAIIQVRALAEAQKRYKLENEQYAEDFDLLDISFSGTPDPATGDIRQKNITLVTSSSNTHKYVYAKPRDKSIANGRWYVLYDLQDQKLYCDTYKTDSISTALCATYGTPIDCRWNSGESCYEIK